MQPLSTELPPADANQILTAISHELRNLLQSISGCNQLIEDALADRQLDRMAGYWRIGHQKQEALSNVVQDILFLIDNQIPQSADVQLADSIRRALHSVSGQAELLNVALVSEQPTADVANACYPEILQRCIQNILEFSIRSCPENGSGQVSVNVRHDVDTQSISISVIDNGCRLSSEEQKLFSNPWRQFDQWDRFLISLAVSRKIANELGGGIGGAEWQWLRQDIHLDFERFERIESRQRNASSTAQSSTASELTLMNIPIRTLQSIGIQESTALLRWFDCCGKQKWAITTIRS